MITAKILHDLDEIIRQVSVVGCHVERLIEAVEGVYPYLTNELVDKLKAAVTPLKGTK